MAWWRVGVVVAVVLGWAGVVGAHPMGNFSVNRYAGVTVDGAGVRVDYRVDYAEIPTVSEMRVVDTDGDREIGDAERAAYLAKRAREFASHLTLTVDGREVGLVTGAMALTKRAGAADLPTLLVSVEYAAKLGAGRHVVRLEDENYADRTGWKEIVVSGGSGGKVVESNVGRESRSAGLMAYPELTGAPPDEREARCVVEVSGEAAMASVAATRATTAPVMSSAGGRGGTPRDAFTGLVSGRELSAGFVVVALGIAMVMGMFHGFSPGHGKTVVAAYLVGSRGTARHAVLLGAVVTMTHVSAVFALGAAVLVASKWFVAEDVYPWVGFVSGLMIVAVGVWQFTRRWALRRATGGAVGHVHGPGGHTHDVPERITVPGLVALGVSGGIVPCPSALVVLMSAIAFKQAAFGMVLIVAFSVGLAGVLIAIGMTMLFARGVLERWDGGAGRVAGVVGRLALASPAAISVLGAGIAVQALVAGRVW